MFGGVACHDVGSGMKRVEAPARRDGEAEVTETLHVLHL